MAPIGTLNSIEMPIWKTDPRSRLARAVAKLAGHEYDSPADFKFGETNKSPEYLAKFPLGKIPTFEGSDGFNLCEGNAIGYYLADIAPAPIRNQLIGGTPQERAKIQQWIWFAEKHLEPAITPLAGWRFDFGAYDAKKEADSDRDLKRWLEYLDNYLQGREWLTDGAGPTLADLFAGGHLYIGFMAYIDAEMRKQYPAILAWYGRLKNDPKVGWYYDTPMVDVRKKPPSE